VVRLRNEHLQYALTWYGLAAVLVVVFVAWAFNSGRGAAQEGAAQHPQRPSRSL
jgi:surfeit locus 1 family protein